MNMEDRAASPATRVDLEAALLQFSEGLCDRETESRPVHVVTAGSCANGSKMEGRKARLMPGPESSMAIRTYLLVGRQGNANRPPRGVNCSAFISRLQMICCRRS